MALLSMLLINMTRVKAPMSGLSSGQVTTICFKKRPEKIDYPATAVIFENAYAPMKNHTKTLGWVELPQEANKNTRPSLCQSPKHWEGANRICLDWNRGNGDIARSGPNIR